MKVYRESVSRETLSRYLNVRQATDITNGVLSGATSPLVLIAETVVIKKETTHKLAAK